MADTVKALSKALSVRLQDSASAGDVNGIRYTADNRLTYINSGYKRLGFMVKSLYPEIYKEVFPDLILTSSILQSDSDGIYDYSDLNAECIKELFCKLPSDSDWNRATYVCLEDYLSTKNALNRFYTPSADTQTYFWTIQQDKIYILPELELSINFTYTRELYEFTYAGLDDILVPSEYHHMIVSLACYEAFMDLGDARAQSYMQDATNSIAVLTAKLRKEQSEK